MAYGLCLIEPAVYTRALLDKEYFKVECKEP